MSREEIVTGLAIGDTIAGKYEIRGLIGKGGIGCVLRAYHRGLDEPVAIKVLNAQALRDTQMRERFHREARAAAKIKSDHIARVFDVGTMAGDIPFLVMELLEGSDLGVRIDKTGPLRVTDAARYVMQACEAIAEAHLLKIVHRDIKPENLFIAERRHGGETTKVLDFGISKSVSQNAHSVTSTSAALGSPLYMSPEQLRSPRDVDHRTDIWSLGVSLHEMTTGLPPFSSDTLAGLALKIVTEEMAPLSSHGPVIDPAFDRVVRRCMAKAVDDRYATVAELVRDLAPFCPEQGEISVRRTAALLARSGDVPMSDVSQFERTVSLPEPVVWAGADVPMKASREQTSTVAWNDEAPRGDQLVFEETIAASPILRSTNGAFGVTDASKKSGASAWIVAALVAAVVVGVGMFWLQHRPAETSRGAASSIRTPTPSVRVEMSAVPTAAASKTPKDLVGSSPVDPTTGPSATPSAQPKEAQPKSAQPKSAPRMPGPRRPHPSSAKAPPESKPASSSLYNTWKPK